jgi:MFS family permease
MSRNAVADRRSPTPFTTRRVIVTYVTTGALFTLSTSLIWSINTLFLLSAGLALPMVFVVNATYTAAQMLCQVPTGVVADTLGRRVSFLLAVATLLVSTVIYVLSAQLRWGIPGFVVGSVLIGLGFTFQTGAVDAWMVDAISACELEKPKEEVLSRVFALAGAVSGGVLVVGPLLGGLLGQISLFLPYYARAGALGLTFVAVAVMMREVGFEPRTLSLKTFGSEVLSLARRGLRYGWGSRVVRPLLWVSLAQGIFFAYGFYSLSPYLLQLIGANHIWLTGAVFSAYALATIMGNLSIRWGLMRHRDGSQRSAPATLAVFGLSMAAIVGLIGVAGLVAPRVLGPGLWSFGIVAGLWVIGGFVFGAAGPVGSAYMNEHIPSAHRATVLSINAMFGDAGAVAGQPTFGYAAQSFGIASTWAVSGLILLVVAPLYRRSGRAAAAQDGTPIDAMTGRIGELRPGDEGYKMDMTTAERTSDAS